MFLLLFPRSIQPVVNFCIPAYAVRQTSKTSASADDGNKYAKIAYILPLHLYKETSKNVASPPKILLSVQIRHTGCAKSA